MPSQLLGFQLFVKRDDATGGVELGGNKIRKLEFLLADALAQGCDSVITIGGEQSNHCRATAAAARMLGLEPHLILRTKQAMHAQDKDDSTGGTDKNNNDIGLVGNVLLDRMVGSQIYTCTPGEYGRIGSQALISRLGQHLKTNLGKRPYLIPVGGSNGIGSWGYIHAVDELVHQWQAIAAILSSSSSSSTLDHVVFACGSGGTAAGIALGLCLAFSPLDTSTDDDNNTTPPTVHAIGVCDDPDYFYNHVAKIAVEMGFRLPGTTTQPSLEDVTAFVRRHLIAHQGKGLGYASSTPEELEFLSHFARATGIVLDPVYSGKALYHFAHHVVPSYPPETFTDKNVLFWHTGGALGLFDKVAALAPTLGITAPCQRLNAYNNDKAIGLPLPPLDES